LSSITFPFRFCEKATTGKKKSKKKIYFDMILYQ
jgi:hypothetical protein